MFVVGTGELGTTGCSCCCCCCFFPLLLLPLLLLLLLLLLLRGDTLAAGRFRGFLELTNPLLLPSLLLLLLLLRAAIVRGRRGTVAPRSRPLPLGVVSRTSASRRMNEGRLKSRSPCRGRTPVATSSISPFSFFSEFDEYTAVSYA